MPNVRFEKKNKEKGNKHHILDFVVVCVTQDLVSLRNKKDETQKVLVIGKGINFLSSLCFSTTTSHIDLDKVNETRQQQMIITNWVIQKNRKKKTIQRAIFRGLLEELSVKVAFPTKSIFQTQNRNKKQAKTTAIDPNVSSFRWFHDFCPNQVQRSVKKCTFVRISTEMFVCAFNNCKSHVLRLFWSTRSDLFQKKQEFVQQVIHTTKLTPLLIFLAFSVSLWSFFVFVLLFSQTPNKKGKIDKYVIFIFTRNYFSLFGCFAFVNFKLFDSSSWQQSSFLVSHFSSFFEIWHKLGLLFVLFCLGLMKPLQHKSKVEKKVASLFPHQRQHK